MSELDEVKKEQSIQKEYNKKKRFILVLGVITASLFAYASFLTVQFIVDLVNKNNNKVTDTICILDKNEQDSQKLYDKWILGEHDFSDIGVYGGYLLTSESRVDKDNFHLKNQNKVAIFKANENKEWTEYGTFKELGNTLSTQINLFATNSDGEYLFENGEYLLFEANGFPSEQRTVYHYTGEDYFNEVIYSLPSKTKIRKKFEIKAKASSPSIVIKVSTLTTLPNDYYDFVVLNSSESSIDWINELKSDYKVYEASSLAEAYKVNAPYAIKISNEDNGTIYSSNYLSEEGNHPDKINGTIYDGLDKDNFIRELGGYVFNAGYGISGEEDYAKASREIKNVLKTTHVGKNAITIGKNTSLSDIKNHFGI